MEATQTAAASEPIFQAVTYKKTKPSLVRLDSGRTGIAAKQLGADLRKKVVGQDEAIHQLVSMYQTHLAGMNSPGRPIGNLLLLGPTGSGKTRLAEAMAECVAGSSKALIKIDCAEFQHSHEIAKLIGSPPGYLGHRETPPALTQQVLNQHHTDTVKISFVLFDEIEKASDSLWDLLLGILDKGTLTLGDNHKVDFSKTMIFMTSNLGAAEMESLVRPSLGFAASEVERKRLQGGNDEKLAGKIHQAGLAAARRKFRPEFMNRIDKVLVFRPLGEAELRKVLELEVRQIQQRIFAACADGGFAFYLTPAARDFLLLEGADIRYGARRLKRALERELVCPLSNLLATDQIHAGDVIRVSSTRSSRLNFYVKAPNAASGASGGSGTRTGDIPDRYYAHAAASRRTHSRREKSANTAG
jgi:ATP-dependent Clp protease ATP-binding subunit ClpB